MKTCMIIRLNILIIVLLVKTCSSLRSVTFYKRGNFAGDKFANLISDFSSKTVFDCATLCLDVNECISFVYNVSNRACSLYTVLNIGTGGNVNGDGLVYAVVESHCPDGWIRMGESCYFLESEGRAKWNDAQDQCGSYNAYLAEVDSDEEHEFLAGLATSVSESSSVLNWYGFWLGGTDAHREGDWIWSGSSRGLNYTKWSYSDKPDNANTGQHCLIMLGPVYTWDDHECSTSQNFICEKSIY